MARQSAAACARLVTWSAFAAASTVVAYSPVENEVDPTVAIEAAAVAGKAIYYPRVGAAGLSFLPAGPENLRPGHRGIPEPAAGESLGPSAGVLFLVPGVAFDPRGVRLGRGGGYYDRALTRHPRATRIGLAYEFQVVPALPEATWDIRMDAIVTDARLVECALAQHGQ